MPSSPRCWRPKPCTEMQAASHLRAFAHALPRLGLPSLCPLACLQSLYHRLVHPDLWPLCHPVLSLGSWSTLQDPLHGPPPCSSGLPVPTIRIVSPLCVCPWRVPVPGPVLRTSGLETVACGPEGLVARKQGLHRCAGLFSLHRVTRAVCGALSGCREHARRVTEHVGGGHRICGEDAPGLYCMDSVSSLLWLLKYFSFPSSLPQIIAPDTHSS